MPFDKSFDKLRTGLRANGKRAIFVIMTLKGNS
jgi:hypothetical protein